MYDNNTPPPDIRPGTRKHFLAQIWEQDSDDEMAVYEANARFKDHPKFKGPVKEATVTGWLNYWRYWRDNIK